MSQDPASRFAPGGRPRGARRGWRDQGVAPPSHAVKRGTGVVLTCTGCGLSIETIEIGEAPGVPDLDAATFQCALCLTGAETFVAPERDPDVHIGPPAALRVIQRHLEAPAKEPLDLLALLGGPEGSPRVEAAPVELLVSRPAPPEAAQDEHADAGGSSHLDALDDGLDAFRRR